MDKNLSKNPLPWKKESSHATALDCHLIGKNNYEKKIVSLVVDNDPI